MNIRKHTQPIYNVIQFASFLLLLLSTRKTIIIIIKTFSPVLKILYCSLSFFLYMRYFFFQMKNICRWWWWCFNFSNLQACDGGSGYHVPPPPEDTLLYVFHNLLLNALETVLLLLLLQSYFFFFPMKGEFLKLTSLFIGWFYNSNQPITRNSPCLFEWIRVSSLINSEILFLLHSIFFGDYNDAAVTTTSKLKHDFFF
jgi:hypothetical protein